MGFSENVATSIFHAFLMMCYLMCVFGAILSDVWWGKFKTIFLISIVYVLGSITLSVSAIPTINTDPKIGLFVGLILIAIGSGGIKPCVSAFSGDQFKLPEQAAHLASFFSLFYLSINLGSLLSSAITPILREDVKCFNRDDCYSLAFGVPAVVLIIAIGKPLNLI